MTNKEIEVGDYVYFKTKNDLYVAQVLNKYLGCDTFILHYGNVIKSETIKDMKPIPISIEIIENNGFTLCNNVNNTKTKQYEYKENDSCVIVYFLNNKPVSFEIYDANNKFKVEKKNVHELQHAMKFYEIKKEIKLEKIIMQH